MSPALPQFAARIAAPSTYADWIDESYRHAWIIMPAFNEASVIADVIGNLRATFPNVVVVDDGSHDDTPALARQAGAHVVTHPVNLGQGAAIQTGVEYARKRAGAQVFATFDADGQHQVRDVVAMIERLGHGDVDIVVGTRFAAGPPTGVPILKRIVLKTVAALSATSRKLKLTDAHNGLRVFNRTVAGDLDITINGMGHASEFIALILENGWRVAEQPVEILYTDYSMSKGQPLLNGVNIVFDGFLRKRLPR